MNTIKKKNKQNDIQDERIILENRKILSRAYILLSRGLIIITVIQMGFFNAKPVQIAGEFSLLLLISAYVIIEKLRNSIPLFPQEVKSKKYIVCCLIISFTISLPIRFLVVKGQTIKEHITSSIFWIILMIIIYLMFFSISNRKQKKIDDELDRQEDDIEDELDKKDDM